MRMMRRLGAALALFMGLTLPAAAQSPPDFVSARRNPGKPVRLLTFTLSGGTLWPAAVEVPEGQYLIRFRNAELVGDVAFVVRDAAKSRSGRVEVKQVPTAKRAAYFDLEAGSYEVVVDNRPEWKATITVVKSKDK